MNWRQGSLLFLAVVLLSACATIPKGPSIMVLPGPGKSFDVFQSDDAACRQWARQQIGTPPNDTVNQNLAKGAAIGTLMGAGLGAAIGAASGEPGIGAAIGAAAGLLGGTAVAAEPAYAAGYEAQMRYDNAYQQCMYSKGNQIPGLMPPSRRAALIREGAFAIKLAEALKIGPVKSEAEAESMLASLGIAPRNGWIAHYPVPPDVIGELQNAIERAADSGKIAMKKEEAIKAFQDLIRNIESQYAKVEPPPGRHPYPEPYYYPELYYYPYYYPYLYYYGGYYRYRYYPYRYHYHRHWGHPHHPMGRRSSSRFHGGGFRNRGSVGGGVRGHQKR